MRLRLSQLQLGLAWAELGNNKQEMIYTTIILKHSSFNDKTQLHCHMWEKSKVFLAP